MGYWENRQAQIMYEQMEDAEKVSKELADIYAKASRELNYKIEQIFEKYATRHHLSNAEAKRLLNTLHTKGDITEMMEALKADPKNADLIAELESGAYRARIQRLEQLHGEIDKMMSDVYNQEKKVSTSHYIDLAQDAYYREIYEAQRRAGFQFSFSAVDPNAVNMVLGSNWSGANYSTRIWGNTTALAGDLKQQILLNLLTGKSTEEAAMEIAKQYATGAFEARRLVRTESNFISGQMQREAYEDCDAEEYDFIAVLDLRTSDICRELDGKVFKVSEMQPGVNCNPMHPFCRSTTSIHLDDDVLAGLKRRARDPVSGENKLIPASTNYQKWYEQNVANNPKAQAAEKMIKNMGSDLKQWEKYKGVIGSKAGKTIEAFQDMKYNDSEGWAKKKALYRRTNSYNKAVAAEPAITEAMKKISEQNGVEMAGLEHRLKTKKSYLRKQELEAAGKTDTEVVKAVVNNAYDTIRYTYLLKPEEYGEGFEQIRKALEADGFTIKEIKNTWMGRSDYRGINTKLITPEGQKFEVQFHTADSFRVKEENHKLYEEARDPKTSTERKRELSRMMREKARSIPTPSGVENIQSMKMQEG